MHDKETQQIIADLDKQAKEIQAKIDELKNKKPKNVRWRAEKGRGYFYINHNQCNSIVSDNRHDCDDVRYDTGNYFRTQMEADKHRQHLIITQKIKDIALRLNDGVEIDWNNENQLKHKIGFSYYSVDGHLCTDSTDKKARWANGNIYCLSDKFLKTCIEEIGEKELIEYIKGC